MATPEALRKLVLEAPRYPRLIFLAGALLLVLEVGFGVLILSFMDRQDEVRAEVNASYETRIAIQRVYNLVQLAETGQRGYLLTGQSAFLEPYERGIANLPARLDELEQMLGASPTASYQVERLRDLVDRKLAELKRVLDARSGGLDAVAPLVAEGSGRVLMEQIRTVTLELVDAQSRALEERLAAETDRGVVTRLGVIAFLVAMLLVSVGGSVLVINQLMARLRVQRRIAIKDRMVGLLRGIAETVNRAPTFGDAVRTAAEVIGRGTTAKVGELRLLPKSGASGAADRMLWTPEGARPGEDLGEAVGKLVEETWQRARPLVVGTWSGGPLAGVEDLNERPAIVVPVVDRGETFASLAFFGLEKDLDPGEVDDMARYASEQLARAAERQGFVDQLTDALLRQEALFASAPSGIVTVNEAGKVESINPAAEELFGYRREDVVHRHIGLLLQLDEMEPAATLAALTSMLDEGRDHPRELVGRRRDGTQVPVELKVSAMTHGEQRLLLVVVNDITERKRIERMKSEFVSTVSHELRTPLTSIAGSLGLLVGGVGGSLSEQAGKLVNIAQQNSQRLVRLINDILDIEKIESGRVSFNFRRIDMNALVAEAAQQDRAFAASYGVELTVVPAPDEAPVEADPDRLTQVITNLVSNAVKFSPRGEAVVIAVEDRGDRVRITVSDRGPGIPDGFRGRLFTKFAQADASDARRKGGTGLGLVIAKDIVERHGGRISFDTEIGRGTAFHVDLPRIATQAVVLPPDLGDRKPVVLICEDDPDVVVLLATAIREHGYLPLVAPTAAAAERLILERQPTAALIDLRLPDKDGITLIRDLRARPEGRDMPMIVVSVDAEHGRTDIHARSLDVLDWLPKPVNFDRLREALNAAMARTARARPRLLHVDDDPGVLQVVAAAFESRCEIISLDSLAGAREALAGGPFDAVILDIGLGDDSGLDLLPELAPGSAWHAPVVIFSARDFDPALAARVEATLTKSRATLAMLVDTVDRLIREGARRVA